MNCTIANLGMLEASLCQILEKLPDSICLIICQYIQICSPRCPNRIIGPETICPDCKSEYARCSECVPKCKMCHQTTCTMECVTRGIEDDAPFCTPRFPKTCSACEDVICAKCSVRCYKCFICYKLVCYKLVCSSCLVECSRCGAMVCTSCGLHSYGQRNGKVSNNCVEFMNERPGNQFR
jgi:hypothetical protein